MIDLGCAPGGWLQVLAERSAGDVVGVDLLPVDPLPPAKIVEGDFTDPGCGARLAALLGGPADLILSDMAPNTTGHRQRPTICASSAYASKPPPTSAENPP